MQAFIINDGILQKYRGKDTEVTVPDTVKEIGRYAFANKKILKSVVIPPSVEKIGWSAFQNCESLERVVLSEGLKEIYPNAFFANRALKEIVIPPSVKSICGGAFSGCHALERVILSEGLKIIEWGAFSYCTALQEIAIPRSVEKIWSSAFRHCESLRAVMIPPSVKQIEAYAFADCYSLENITISEGVEEIGMYAFLNCRSLREITFPSSIRKISKSVDVPSGLKTITFNGLPPRPMNAFRYCVGKKVIVYAPKASVMDFSILKQEYLEGYLRLLGRGETISEEIAAKNSQYFQRNARALCGSASDELFDHMLKNKLIPLKDTDEIIAKMSEKKQTERVAALIDYTQTQFSAKEREKQFARRFALKEPTLTELKQIWTLKKLDDGTYRISAYKGEESCIVIPSSIRGAAVTELGNGVWGLFDETRCEKIKSVILPESLQKIGSKTFKNCTALERIVLPEGVKIIDGYAFENCARITFYCRAKKKPTGWSRSWARRSGPDRKQATVVWDYQGV